MTAALVLRRKTSRRPSMFHVKQLGLARKARGSELVALANDQEPCRAV